MKPKWLNKHKNAECLIQVLKQQSVGYSHGQTYNMTQWSLAHLDEKDLIVKGLINRLGH